MFYHSTEHKENRHLSGNHLTKCDPNGKTASTPKKLWLNNHSLRQQNGLLKIIGVSKIVIYNLAFDCPMNKAGNKKHHHHIIITITDEEIIMRKSTGGRHKSRKNCKADLSYRSYLVESSHTSWQKTTVLL